MLSVPHLIIIFLVALIVLGPEKLPEVARTLSKFMTDWQSATGGLRETLEEEMRNLEREIRETKSPARQSSSSGSPPALNPAGGNASEETTEEEASPTEDVAEPADTDELASVGEEPYDTEFREDDEFHEDQMNETPEPGEVPEEIEKVPEKSSGTIHEEAPAEGQNAAESTASPGKPTDGHTTAA